MGYTHYWILKEEKYYFKKLNTIKEELSKVLNKYKKHIQLEYNNDLNPLCYIYILNGRYNLNIQFNGIEDDGHETFLFDTDHDDFTFCKTARKYYDKAVCECLLILKYYLKDNLELTSDGFSSVQPNKKKKYKVGDVVKYSIDGYWSQSLKNVNKQLNTDMYFECDEVYGNKNQYIKYKLKC